MFEFWSEVDLHRAVLVDGDAGEIGPFKNAVPCHTHTLAVLIQPDLGKKGLVVGERRERFGWY